MNHTAITKSSYEVRDCVINDWRVPLLKGSIDKNIDMLTNHVVINFVKIWQKMNSLKKYV